MIEYGRSPVVDDPETDTDEEEETEQRTKKKPEEIKKIPASPEDQKDIDDWAGNRR